MDNSTGIDLPPIPDDLLDALDKKYPDRCPDLLHPDRMIWFDAGRRSVVNYLRDQHERQQRGNLGLPGFPSAFAGEEA